MVRAPEPYVLNIGPQHPSTHGVFRIRVEMDGEVIRDLDMIVGYLHRSMEKLAEERTYTQNIPFTDRADYLAAMSGNLGLCLTAERLAGVEVPERAEYLHRSMEKLAEERTYTQNIPFTDRADYLAAMSGNLGLCVAAERLAGVEVPERAEYLRVIFAELQRIASHAMANGTLVSDAGAWQTPLLYMFREREKILDLFEMTCGARLTTNYMRIGGVAFDPPPEFWPALQELVDELPERIDEYSQLLKENEVFVARTRGVGVISPEDAINGSLVGPALRGSGVPWDLRKAEPYGIYDRFNFDIVVGRRGDVYDRFMVRMEETRQSASIIRQAMAQIPDGPHKNEIPLALRPEPGEVYGRVEGPRGEIGFYLVSDGTPAPYRFHIRAPSLINLSLLRELAVGASLPDAVVTLGSIDIVVGEIDR